MKEVIKLQNRLWGSLDDDGYLRRELSSIADDLAFRQSLVVEEKEIEEIISQIQQFDPAGIAARDLRECLLPQLKRKTDEGKSVELAVQILTKYFDEFTKKHYEKIQKSLGLSDDQLKEVIAQIIKLNPKPGGNVGEMNKEAHDERIRLLKSQAAERRANNAKRKKANKKASEE